MAHYNKGFPAATRKREVTSGDVCVFLANASTTGEITVEAFEQDF
jgi:hypothetical protein